MADHQNNVPEEVIELNEMIQESRNSLLTAIPDLNIYSTCAACVCPRFTRFLHAIDGAFN